jgi:hypothetical protein
MSYLYCICSLTVHFKQETLFDVWLCIFEEHFTFSEALSHNKLLKALTLLLLFQDFFQLYKVDALLKKGVELMYYTYPSLEVRGVAQVLTTQ